MQILENLYFDSVLTGKQSGVGKAQYKQALAEIIKADSTLRETLTEEQKELFEAYIEAQREISILTDLETYIQAFRLGAKIMMDVLMDGEPKGI